MESVDEDERGPLECIGFASSSGRDTDGVAPILVRTPLVDEGWVVVYVNRHDAGLSSVAAADDRAIEGGQ
jgi:hypothetical protein